MARATVMTDKVGCIPTEVADQRGITVVPTATILYDGKAYTEGLDITAAQAYQLIKKDPDKFDTSALTPGRLAAEYRRLSADYDEILVVTIASKVSALFNMAKAAAEEFVEESPDTKIRVVDSRTAAGAQGLMALALAKATAKGATLEELVTLAEHVRSKTGGVMLLDTLRYIYRSGRMTRDEALQAAKLRIKPVNRMSDEGAIEPADIVRTRTDGYTKVVELIKREADTDALHFTVSHANAPHYAAALARLLRREFNCLSVLMSDFSPVMGYATGPGALFVGFQPQLALG